MINITCNLNIHTFALSCTNTLPCKCIKIKCNILLTTKLVQGRTVKLVHDTSILKIWKKQCGEIKKCTLSKQPLTGVTLSEMWWYFTLRILAFFIWDYTAVRIFLLFTLTWEDWRKIDILDVHRYWFSKV